MAGLNRLEPLPQYSIGEWQAALEKRTISSVELVRLFSARIRLLDWDGPNLRSVLEINPEAVEIAARLDRERRQNGPRGPLHGLPLFLKDNIDTADLMHTSAGSWALVGSKPLKDALVARKLREAGAILLGKTNLTEWSSFRSMRKSSGWSGRGGQCRNPYALDRSPYGSSSGSAVAVAANLGVAALGTETDGSIVNPASICGVVGLKPTVGLVSRAGIIPIAHSQDTVGPITRSVTDAALLLGALTGPDPDDPATQSNRGNLFKDYTQSLRKDGLKGARIGVARQPYFNLDPPTLDVMEAAIQTMREQGAVIVDPANIATAQEIIDSPDAMTVLSYEFKHDLNAYLANRPPHLDTSKSYPITALKDLIAFNKAYPDLEMPYFGQELFEEAEARGSLDDETYRVALANNRRRSRQDGLDSTFAKFQLDALVAPTVRTAWPIDLLNGDPPALVSSTPAALAGYPLITVPVGFVSGLPVGITFMGLAFSEPTLIKLAYAFEQARPGLNPPHFLETVTG